MNRTVSIIVLLFAASAPLHAQSVQYVSDDVSFSLREAPRNDARIVGSVRSGQKLSVLEVLGADSFARVRTGDGREGWMTARYLSTRPAAKDQQAQLRSELQTAQQQIKTLEARLKDAGVQLEKARPAMELARENDRLKNELTVQQQAMAAMEQRYGAERERRATLVTGATLVGGGMLAGLLLPWLLQWRRRRRWGDF